jgi:hypothetical protein
VTHRLDIHRQDRTTILEFQGLLDATALAGLRVCLTQARASGARPRILLREGTEVERRCLAELRAMGAPVIAEAAYLASWLREDAKSNPPGAVEPTNPAPDADQETR